MSDQYVFELKFNDKNGKPNRENQFVIIDGGSMESFSKLKEDLYKCVGDAFTVQYYEDDDDIIHIDSEEEFKEFAKLARQRSSKGLLMKLILDSNIPSDHGQFPSPIKQPKCEDRPRVKCPLDNTKPNVSGIKDQAIPKLNETFIAFETEMDENSILRSCSEINQVLRNISALNNGSPLQYNMNELKSKIKSELKTEILAEIAGDTETLEQITTEAYEEDSDENIPLVYIHERSKKEKSCQHKKQKKEEILGDLSQLDQRLEKLQLKKKKLLEKAHLKTAMIRKPTLKFNYALPSIMSGIATRESIFVTTRKTNSAVTAGKVFSHVWHVVNDGTVTWNNVELRNIYNSPGLEPDELSIKMFPLAPGQEATVAVKFKAPKIIGSFLSYWYFFQLVDSQWQQFGHYVSLTGNTKSPKHGLSAGAPTKDGCKKSKLDSKTVTFSGWNEDLPYDETTGEPKVLNEECSNQLENCKKHLEASLASSEIAAEMARVASKAAIKRAVGNIGLNNAPKSSEMDKLNNCLDEVMMSVQGLNLVDSGSDTDANLETDPEYVVVEIDGRPCSVAEKPKEEKMNKKFKVDSVCGENEVYELEMRKEDENNSSHVPMTNKDNADEDNKDNAAKKNAEITVITGVNKAIMDALLQHEPNDEPMSFPRIDPNVNYPVFPPRVTMPIFPPIPPPQLVAQHVGAAHNHYQLFTPQNSSSHAVVFPPPMMHFSAPKINPPVHYPQIPTYPPMPATSHQMPLISSGMPPPPTMAPPPQMPPPPMSNAPPVAFPMNPQFQVYTYDMPHTAPTVVPPSSESQTHNSSSSSVTDHNCGMETAASETTTAVSETLPQREIRDISGAQTEANPGAPNKKSEPAVQILPQALVDGAINVAASAYSTAWNALTNLRTKEGEATEFDPVFENNMALLVEMGFNNLERNARLLKRFNNDVSQVIGVICATGGAHNLDID